MVHKEQIRNHVRVVGTTTRQYEHVLASNSKQTWSSSSATVPLKAKNTERTANTAIPVFKIRKMVLALELEEEEDSNMVGKGLVCK